MSQSRAAVNEDLLKADESAAAVCLGLLLGVDFDPLSEGDTGFFCARG